MVSLGGGGVRGRAQLGGREGMWGENSGCQDSNADVGECSRVLGARSRVQWAGGGRHGRRCLGQSWLSPFNAACSFILYFLIDVRHGCVIIPFLSFMKHLL